MSPSATPRSAAAFDVAAALAAALVWGAGDVALGGGRGGASGSGLVDALGRAAAVAVPLVFVLRSARPWPRSLSALCLGALLVAVPLAVLGALLVEKTNHRALGAVTFAILALASVVLGWLLALRLLPREPAVGPEGTSAGARIGSVGLAVVGASALLVLVAVLFSGPAEARGAAVGLLSMGLATGVPARSAPRVVGVTSALVALALVLAAAANPLPPG